MLSGVTVCVLVLALGWAVSADQYDNNFDRYARIKCPKNEILSYVGSVRSNEYRDRRWRFQCTKSPGATRVCSWTNYINALDGPLQYTCPGGKVLNGMRTYIGDRPKDRSFMIQCCTVARKSTNNCYYTEFVNDWREEMNFHVPTGRAIKGVYSVYDNTQDDRRWKFYVCDLA